MSIIQTLQTKYLDGLFNSPTKKEEKKQFKRYSFSKYIRPQAFDKSEGIWYTTDNQCGLVIEIIPRIRMGGATAESFEEILSHVKENIFMQLILFGSKNIEEYIKLYTYEHTTRDNQLAINAVNAFNNHIRKKTKESISRDFLAQIRDNKAFLCLKGDYKDIKDIKNTILNLLESGGFAPKILDGDSLLPIFYELLNINHNLKDIPQYNEDKFFNNQVITNSTQIKFYKDHIDIDDKKFVALTPTKLPKKAHIAEFGLKLGDYISEGMNTNQFIDSYFITLNLTRTSKMETFKIKQAKEVTSKAQAKGTKAKQIKSDISNIIEGIDNRKPIFKVDMNIFVGGDTLELANKNADIIISHWKKKSGVETGGIVLEKFHYMLSPLLIGSLPLGINDEYIETITKSQDENHFIEEVSQFLPLEADYKGNYPHLTLLSRRGQIMGIDFTKTDYSKNAYIAAASGAGKSVLLNFLAFNSYCRNDRTFIIDIGRSYEPLCGVLDGEFLDIDPDKPMSFNPFSDIKTKEKLKEDLSFLSDWIYMMGANLNENRALEEEKFIKGTIENIINEKWDVKKEHLEITDIQHQLLRKEDTRLKDFGIHLNPYCNGGAYEGFFKGPKEINLDNDFVVLEIDKAESKADIRDTIIFVMIYHISNTVYQQDDGRRTQVIIDEAHKFMGKNKKMDDFFDQAYRRFRKHNASIILATQSFEDIYNASTGGLSRAGQTIIANSPWKIFLKQEETSINILMNSKVFNFDEIDEAIFRKVKTVKGQYSEMLLMTPNNEKIPSRLVMDRFFLYLVSTDPADKQLIKQTMQRFNMQRPEAINHIIREEEKNVA